MSGVVKNKKAFYTLIQVDFLLNIILHNDDCYGVKNQDSAANITGIEMFPKIRKSCILKIFENIICMIKSLSDFVTV